MTAAPDAGDIVCQKKIAISDDDTARTLHEKLARTSRELLDEILPQIKSGKAPRTPQDAAEATYFGGRRPADGEIDWSDRAHQIRNLVRAVTRPYPGAFSSSGRQEVPVLGGIDRSWPHGQGATRARFFRPIPWWSPAAVGRFALTPASSSTGCI